MRNFRTPRSVTETWTEWFTVWEGEADSTTPDGPQDAIMLHPLTMPGTPYSTACTHYTHRTELAWQMKAICTSSLNTGARWAALVLPDPNYAESITTSMAWNATTNGLGMSITAMGLRETGRSFHVLTSTARLSNALPAVGASTLGYAAGVLVIVLLVPPKGLGSADTGQDRVDCRIFMRCHLRVHNPVPGFGVWEQQLFTHPEHPQTPADWTLQVANQYVGATNMQANNMYNGSNCVQWAVSHRGTIPLAGGYYWMLPVGANGAPPSIGTSNNIGGKTTSAATITGNPQWGAVYICNPPMPVWENNRSIKLAPRYFAIIKGWASGIYYVVGFVTEQNASNQADGRWSSIPAGAELALTYNTPPKWTSSFPVAPIVTSSANPTPVTTISFWSVFKSSSTGSVYTAPKPLGLSLEDDPGEGTSTQNPYSAQPAYIPALMTNVSHDHNYRDPPTAPDWTSDESSEDDDCCPEHIYDGKFQPHITEMTPEQLSDMYATALETINQIDLETARRQQCGQQPHDRLTVGTNTEPNTIWQHLRDRLNARRHFLA